jgi:hypothetical protein
MRHSGSRAYRLRFEKLRALPPADSSTRTVRCG